MANAAYLKAPDWVSFSENLAMVRSVHARLWVFLDTLLGRDHPSAHSMDAFAKYLDEQETDRE